MVSSALKRSCTVTATRNNCRGIQSTRVTKPGVHLRRAFIVLLVLAIPALGQEVQWSVECRLPGDGATGLSENTISVATLSGQAPSSVAGPWSGRVRS